MLSVDSTFDRGPPTSMQYSIFSLIYRYTSIGVKDESHCDSVRVVLALRHTMEIGLRTPGL